MPRLLGDMARRTLEWSTQDDDIQNIGDAQQEDPCGPGALSAPGENPYADWSARLFTADRAQYILVVNTTSLYPVLMHGRGITDDNAFIERAVTAIEEQLDADRLSFLFARSIVPETAGGVFSKALNRSVTGSLNDFVAQAKFHLAERGLLPFGTARILADCPMGALKYGFPRDVFASMSGSE